MKKIPSVFMRNYETDRLIRDEVVPGCEWVIAGEGIATRKHDGSCCAAFGGEFYRRYDAKGGKTPPRGFVPVQDPDPATGHWPGWIPVDAMNRDDIWFVAAYNEARKQASYVDGIPYAVIPDGTYEAIGPHFNGNAEQKAFDTLIRHGCIVLKDVPRTFDGLREYLTDHYIEGIVFHHMNGNMAKVKRTDFGLEWNGKIRKR